MKILLIFQGLKSLTSQDTQLDTQDIQKAWNHQEQILIGSLQLLVEASFPLEASFSSSFWDLLHSKTAHLLCSLWKFAEAVSVSGYLYD